MCVREEDGLGNFVRVHVDGEALNVKVNVKAGALWEYGESVRIVSLCLHSCGGDADRGRLL